MSDSSWDFEKICNILAGPKLPRPKYIITDDKDEFLNRIEQRAHYTMINGIKNNLRYLEDLDRVRAVRDGADIFETFPMLKDWNNK